METTLRKFRIAMRFSLWMSALYWAGGGVLFLGQGMSDPASIVVSFLSIGTFVWLLWGGALGASASRNMKEFILERPLYLVAGLFLFILVAPGFSVFENLGLAVVSGLFIAGLALSAYRLHQHVKAHYGGEIRQAKADQAFLLFAMCGVAASCIFFDGFFGAFGVTLGFASGPVAVVNWVNIVFPPLALLALRPFREPLKFEKPRIDESATAHPSYRSQAKPVQE